MHAQQQSLASFLIGTRPTVQFGAAWPIIYHPAEAGNLEQVSSENNQQLISAARSHLFMDDMSRKMTAKTGGKNEAGLRGCRRVGAASNRARSHGKQRPAHRRGSLRSGLLPAPILSNSNSKTAFLLQIFQISCGAATRGPSYLKAEFANNL